MSRKAGSFVSTPLVKPATSTVKVKEEDLEWDPSPAQTDMLRTDRKNQHKCSQVIHSHGQALSASFSSGIAALEIIPVSYTHLTLPTILLV